MLQRSKHANLKKSHFDKSQFDNKHSFMVRLEYCKFCLQQISHYGNTVFIKQVMSQRRLIWATTLSCGRNTPIWKKSKFCKSQFDNKHSFMVIDLNIVSFACNKYLIMVTLCSSDSDVTDTPDTVYLILLHTPRFLLEIRVIIKISKNPWYPINCD